MRHGAILTILIVLALLGGALYGQTGTPESLAWMRWTGELILVRPLLLLLVPIVATRMMSGVVALRDASRVGVVGGAAILYFVVTMLIAVVLGTSVMMLWAPAATGAGLSHAALDSHAASALTAAPDLADRFIAAHAEGTDELGGAWLAIVNQIVPNNLGAEILEGRMLGVVMVALALGLALAAGGRSAEPMTRVIQSFHDALRRIAGVVAWLAVPGLFFMTAATSAGTGSVFVPPTEEPVLGSALRGYVVTVSTGLAIYALLVLPILLLLFTRSNPWKFLWQMRLPLLVALGTSSSSATLPLTMHAAMAGKACSQRSAAVVIPLGAAISMSGTALFKAAAAIFLFQVYGIELQFIEILVVVLTATLASIGTAGIPSAGLVTLGIVLGAVNTSLAGRGAATIPLSAVGVIVGVDRLLDSLRTAVNVWGDLVGARILSRLAPDEAPAAGS